MILLGWAFDIPILKSPSPAFSTIKSNVALCFILIGVSLWLQQTKRVNNRKRPIAQISRSFSDLSWTERPEAISPCS